MKLDAVRELAQAIPQYRTVLLERVKAINNYPDDKVYLAEEVVPLLALLIDFTRQGVSVELVDRAWVEIFKGSAKFTKSYTTQNLDAGNENFMKFLDIAIHSANPEHSHQVGLTKKRR